MVVEWPEECLASTLKCNTQLFVKAEVARPVEISISNMQKHLGEGTGFPPSETSAHTLCGTYLLNPRRLTTARHPTANQRIFYRELVRTGVECAAGDAFALGASLYLKGN